MKLPRLFALALLAASALASPAKRQYATHDYYILEHDPLLSSLDDVVRLLGVEVVGQTGQLLHHWLVRVEKPPDLAKRDTTDRVLERFENLRVSIQDSHRWSRSTDANSVRDIVSSVKYLSRQTLRKRAKRAPPPIRPPDEEKTSAAVALRLNITDPLFSDQWHLVNDDFPANMMNVTGLWEMGITGKGVITALVDDGVDYTSKDLADNFVRSS
jgi:kexin